MGKKPPAWHMIKGLLTECNRKSTNILLTTDWDEVTCTYCLRRHPDPEIRAKAHEKQDGHYCKEKDQCLDKAEMRNIFDRYVQIGETILFND